jgi:hypothetical protein
MALASIVPAAPVTLAWDRPTHNTDGTVLPTNTPLTYIVLTGASPGVYIQTNETAGTTHTIDVPVNELRYSAVIARNALGLESAPTPELTYAAGASPDSPGNLRAVGAVTIVNNAGIIHVHMPEDQ